MRLGEAQADMLSGGENGASGIPTCFSWYLQEAGVFQTCGKVVMIGLLRSATFDFWFDLCLYSENLIFKIKKFSWALTSWHFLLLWGLGSYMVTYFMFDGEISDFNIFVQRSNRKRTV